MRGVGMHRKCRHDTQRRYAQQLRRTSTHPEAVRLLGGLGGREHEDEEEAQAGEELLAGHDCMWRERRKMRMVLMVDRRRATNRICRSHRQRSEAGRPSSPQVSLYQGAAQAYETCLYEACSVLPSCRLDATGSSDEAERVTAGRRLPLCSLPRKVPSATPAESENDQLLEIPSASTAHIAENIFWD